MQLQEWLRGAGRQQGKAAEGWLCSGTHTALTLRQCLYLSGKSGVITEQPLTRSLLQVIQYSSSRAASDAKHLLIFYFSLVQALTYQQTHTTVTSQVLEGNLQEHNSLSQTSTKWKMLSSQRQKYKLQFIRQLTPKHRGHPLKHNPKPERNCNKLIWVHLVHLTHLQPWERTPLPKMAETLSLQPTGVQIIISDMKTCSTYKKNWRGKKRSTV